jgi:ribonuclease E
MPNTMLIDSSHPEETRVVVLRGNRVEEFDFESAARKQLRGNIYLAKVTRVEPSLQAAFVDFGGNRHGFLAFSEIHPDYYQIPVADREALLAEDARSARRGEEEEEENHSRRSKRRTRPRRNGRAARRDDESVSEDATALEASGETAPEATAEAGADDAHQAREVQDNHDHDDHDADDSHHDDHGQDDHGDDDHGQHDNGDDDHGHDDNGHDEEDHVEQIGGGDALEEITERSYRPRRQYKIQEVIKRRQVLLVQVVKEERGNKGAALTTYLSLAGRYSVLMPNTARGGGISRKITSSDDRKRLKSMAQELEVPEGMGVILRTAGASRTKAEIKRDFEYLLRVWENVRELTLQSSAPNLVYEEGSLVKRAIRDLYSKDIDEVHVSGEEGYREAKDFMRMLMPSHAKAVKPFREPQPLFARFGVEAQLDAMFNNVVTLKSGGYIVMNQTEALVAIDVNSGRSTREHNIEDTALKTNLEAADEVARQLRLRDLAGLIVIDFIDMEESRNNKAVERKVKDALKNDRARIQVGRISHFGLLEMSRQRIRTGVLESSTSPCPHCNGTGFLRSTPSLALHLVRAIEDTLLRNASHDLIIRTRTEVAFYVLNHKRPHLRALEERFGVIITILADDHLSGGQSFVVERGEPAAGPTPEALAKLSAAPIVEPEEDDEVEDFEEAEDTEADGERHEARGDDTNGDDQNGRRRKRRRRRRGGRGESGHEAGQENGHENGHEDAEHAGDESASGEEASESGHDDDEHAAEATGAHEDGEGRRRRRRGRRGGRRRQGEETGSDAVSAENDDTAPVETPAPVEPEAVAAVAAEPEAPIEAVEAAAPAEKPKRTRTRKPKTIEAEAAAEAPAAEVEEAAPAPKPARTRRKAAAKPVAEEAAAAPQPETETAVQPEPAPVSAEPENSAPVLEVSDPNKPKRSGWWARAKHAISGD